MRIYPVKISSGRIKARHKLGKMRRENAARNLASENEGKGCERKRKMPKKSFTALSHLFPLTFYYFVPPKSYSSGTKEKNKML